MNFFIQRFSVVMLPLVLGACISRIDVKKINNADINAVTKAKGVRYSLPQPFVIGTPQPNGKVSYRIEYLPDPDNEYAVNSWSFMAKHKMNLTRNANGMLKTVTYTQDGSAVPAAMVDTAGNIAQAQIQAMATAAVKKPSAADGNVPAPGSPHSVKGEVGASTAIKDSPGPVIYRVVEDSRYGVRLEPVSFKVTLRNGGLNSEQQRNFETTGSPDSGSAPSANKPALVSPEPSYLLKKSDFAGQDNLSINITFNMAVKLGDADWTFTELDSQKDRKSWAKVLLDSKEKKAAVVTLTKASVGTIKYKLTLKVSSIADPSQVSDVVMNIEVQN